MSRAVGNSVVRHRVLRVLRAQTRPLLGTLPSGSLLVVRALPPAAAADSAHTRLGPPLGAGLRGAQGRAAGSVRVSGVVASIGDRLALRSTRPLNPVSRVLTWPLLALIRLYQWTLSPLLGPVCRYHPSCSRYGFGSIHDHGPLLGSWLAGRRILRCNPWARGGVDPVARRGAGWATLVWRARAPEGAEALEDPARTRGPARSGRLGSGRSRPA